LIESKDTFASKKNDEIKLAFKYSIASKELRQLPSTGDETEIC